VKHYFSSTLHSSRSNAKSHVIFWLVYGFVMAAIPAVAGARPIELADLNDIVHLTDPQLSPDGKTIAVVVARANLEENQYQNQLYLIDVNSGIERPLTHGRHGVHAPRWSPDGKSLAFLAGDANAVSQVFDLPLAGGEARQITQSPTPVFSYAWRPSGQDMVFVRRDEPVKREGIQRHNKSFEAGDDNYLARAEALPLHLWLVSVTAGDMTRLTDGDEGVNGFISMVYGSGISWSPDGSLIAFVSQLTPHDNDFEKSAIIVVSMDDRSTRVFARDPQVLSARPAFSPDGTYLSYHRSTGPLSLMTPRDMFMKPVAGGTEIQLGAKIDRNLTGDWLADGKAVLFHGFDHTSKGIWKVSLQGTVTKLDWQGLEPLSDISSDATGGIAFVAADPQTPRELYYASSVDKKPRKMTRFNDQFLAMETGKVGSIRWKSHDGFDVNGVLIYPPDFDPRKKYPLVLNIHGGPVWTSTEAFEEFAGFDRVMAAKGWLVFNPNYRGSINMGYDFQYVIAGDPSVGPGKDVMAGIEAIKALGIVDDKRIAVSGWSYGGLMTAWLTGNYQGWAAAVAGAAVVDWLDQGSLTDINMLARISVGPVPWQEGYADAYREASPITYSPQSRTPTLILAMTGDARVPITQSYKLYHALKANGVSTQFIAYPIPGHVPGDPVHMQDVFERWFNWIEDRFDEVDNK